ncbi:MAG: 4Fe-4S binding protein [Gammaproteobacteria bacterium]|nr:4Fe-4S binding protein [Gammaproteobacteria bacterium]
MPRTATRTALQRWRSLTQVGFFALFVLAPPLDIFRYDLTIGNFILFGHHWTLNLDALQHGQATAVEAAVNVLLLGLLPIVLIVVGFLFVAWRWGRIYCGWFCPHFSVVEIINRLMQRAIGKPSLWEKESLPEAQADGSMLHRSRWYLVPTILAVVGFALLWSVSLLTYLLPPFEIYSNILNAELTRNQTLFLLAATTAFCIEFLLARHLFCRFGCAVGLFQSLAWMANRRAMVISFNKDRAPACRSCNNACDNACPMRLQPRTIKRKMFTCTECGECISACTQVQGNDPQQSLLHWVDGDNAEKLSEPPMGIPESLPTSPAAGKRTG